MQGFVVPDMARNSCAKIALRRTSVYVVASRKIEFTETADHAAQRLRHID
jgi:hypothetical protein